MQNKISLMNLRTMSQLFKKLVQVFCKSIFEENLEKINLKEHFEARIVQENQEKIALKARVQ